MEYFREKNLVSTTENLAIFIWQQLISHFSSDVKLFEIKIYETEKNIVLYRGE